MLVLREAAQVQECLRHPQVIMADTGRRGCPLTGAELQDRDGGLLAMNPPALKQIRAAISGLLSADAAESLPTAEAVARDLAAVLALGNETDLRAGYAEPFCARMVCHTLGLPPGEWRYLHAASRAAFGIVPPGAVEETRRAWDSLYAYYERLVQDAWGPDGGPVLCLATGVSRPGPAGLIGQITGAMRRAGYDARTIVRTLATISNGFPAVFPVLTRCLTELLREHPPGTVPRCLRGELDWGEAADGLMQTAALFPFALPRQAQQDVTLAGREIPAGTGLLPALVAAGRAGAPPSIAFGAGPHYCPGAAHTRLWVTAAVRVFFEAFPHARLAGDPERLEWDDATLRTPRALPVVLR
jgi:cytochrome P450